MRAVGSSVSILLASAFVALCTAACGTATAIENDDAGSGNDAGIDAGTHDAGTDAGTDAGSDAGTPDDGTSGSITTTPGTWSWVGFANSECSDGSPTGIGVNLSSTSSDLLVYFEGGGACWSYLTCYQLLTATNGPYTSASFASESSHFGNSLLDPSATGSPFAGWNMVFVPYCTGDVHAGNNLATYTSGNITKTYAHKGRANLEAYVARLAATFPHPSKLIVSGSSAGGFGALINFDYLATTWPNASAYLIDDSGPALEGSAIPTATLDAWFSSWSLGAVTDPICGTGCRGDLSKAYSSLSTKYPHAHMSLLSSEQDQTIRTYFQLTPAQFQTDLNAVATDRLDVTSNWKEFFASGQTHTMLLDPQDFTVNNVTLIRFITEQVSDSASWATQKPGN